VKYLLLLTNQAEEIAGWLAMSDEDRRRFRAGEVPKWGDLFAWVEEKGLKLDGLELDPREARTVRVRDGETLVTDGPYAETKEQVGGIFVVECDDLDDAIEVASRVPLARKAAVEIRPLVEAGA
jgi:hypothetical protein